MGITVEFTTKPAIPIHPSIHSLFVHALQGDALVLISYPIISEDFKMARHECNVLMHLSRYAVDFTMLPRAYAHIRIQLNTSSSHHCAQQPLSNVRYVRHTTRRISALYPNHTYIFMCWFCVSPSLRTAVAVDQATHTWSAHEVQRIIVVFVNGTARYLFTLIPMHFVDYYANIL